ncbi:hypothetical protein [Nostoc sp.]|uniref:hypothetical protein n=1 Tax=Nostoc sp. TaxID=1180 RepID=UPI002FFADDCE
MLNEKLHPLLGWSFWAWGMGLSIQCPILLYERLRQWLTSALLDAAQYKSAGGATSTTHSWDGVSRRFQSRLRVGVARRRHRLPKNSVSYPDSPQYFEYYCLLTNGT